MHLTAFRIARPRLELPQERILEWLTEAHARAAEAQGEAYEASLRRVQRLVRHVCCGPDRIASRGVSVSMDEAVRALTGAGTAERTDRYATEADLALERLYEGETEPPSDLVHVTCTGYLSPSAAQRLVAARGFPTRVTHAYHMGCYASVPALRIALGLLASGGTTVDVVHTELCSLHFDPSHHSPEQLVVQSLFADGSIRYTAREDAATDGASLRVLAVHEEVQPGTADAMRWREGDHGMRMTLAREIPEILGRAVRPFVASLFARGGGRDFGRDRSVAVFAVHPGGPKIIDTVRDALELREDQVAASRRILSRYGNMSSATLPHIFCDVLQDPAHHRGALVAGLAFGPGLTLAGVLLRKD